MKKIFFSVYLFAAGAAFAFVTTGPKQEGTTRVGGGPVACPESDPNCLPNPLTYTNLTDLLDGIAKFLLNLSVPVAAIIVISGALDQLAFDRAFGFSRHLHNLCRLSVSDCRRKRRES